VNFYGTDWNPFEHPNDFGHICFSRITSKDGEKDKLNWGTQESAVLSDYWVAL
jgi:hypothetical protein